MQKAKTPIFIGFQKIIINSKLKWIIWQTWCVVPWRRWRLEVENGRGEDLCLSYLQLLHSETAMCWWLAAEMRVRGEKVT